MGQFLLLLVVAVTAAAVVFGVTVLLTGSDPGLAPAEPDGRAVPLPASRPLAESDVGEVRFDTALRGYRMSQVDRAFQRAAYDIGYKDELIGVLEAEVAALREGRGADADALRRARVAALAPVADGAEAAPTGSPVRRPEAEQATVAATTAPVDADTATAPVNADTTAPVDADSTTPVGADSAAPASTDRADTDRAAAPADAVVADADPAGTGSVPDQATQDVRAESAGTALRSERG
ncbi:DivIVA domain-containing protein [Micromonospora sp. NBC_01699]|uniref:DivIVA domain-containing protein n=1 Tax=Micromonospora sp. NBC_01699 TaxID=2975984 RepID=UPI002E2D0657|nr:DivIVA domain-containing protein [Micromonospora sp. NBC_01699]